MLKNIKKSPMHVLVVDLLPYDGTLALACATGLKVADSGDAEEPALPALPGVSGVSRKKRRIEDEISVSSVGCISVLWAGGEEHIRLTKNHIHERITQSLLQSLRTGNSSLPAASEVPAVRSFDTFTTAVLPVLDESRFKHTRPLSDKTLPILQSVYDEFEDTDSGVKAEFEEFVKLHNVEWNRSCKPFNNRKRGLDDTETKDLDAEGAVNLAGQPGIPQTKARTHSRMKLKRHKHCL